MVALIDAEEWSGVCIPGLPHRCRIAWVYVARYVEQQCQLTISTASLTITIYYQISNLHLLFHERITIMSIHHFKQCFIFKHIHLCHRKLLCTYKHIQIKRKAHDSSLLFCGILNSLLILIHVLINTLSNLKTLVIIYFNGCTKCTLFHNIMCLSLYWFE